MTGMSEYLQGLPPAQQRQVKEHITAAVLAVDLCRRCLEGRSVQTETLPQFRLYLGQAMHALQAVAAVLPREV